MKDGDLSKIESVTRQDLKNEIEDKEDEVSLSGSVSSFDDKKEEEKI